MKEILPGVYTWAWPSPERTIDFNGWYVATPGDAAVVDPAPCHDDVLDEIERLGSPQAIILTNKDHTRQSERFAGRFRAPILIHRADASLAPARIGGLFKHGDELPGGLTAIRIPDASSPGECALLLRRANAIILGAALIGAPPGRLSLAPGGGPADPLKAREGIRTLLGYAFDAVLVAAGTPIPRGGRKAVEEYLARAGD